MFTRIVSLRIGAFLVFAVMLAAAGCRHVSSSAKADGSSDEDPFSDLQDDNRETVLIEPGERTQAFTVSPAIFDTALVRVGARRGSAAIIEVLVKGSFPDGCTELNALDQEPSHEGQRVALTMRRPGNAICTQVVRPYRFFFTLDRRFGPGRYTLVINGKAFAFHVTDPTAQ